MTYDAFAKSILDHFMHALPESLRPLPDYLVNDNDTIDAAFRYVGYRNTDGLSQSRLRSAYDSFLSGINLPITGAEIGHRVWPLLLHGFNGNKATLTFKMIMMLALHTIKTNPHIKRALQMTYSFVFLDEFQDTTDIQYALVKECFFGSATKITAVGDNKQRIMVWAGAVKTIFNDFYKELDPLGVRLVMNHRSAPRLAIMKKRSKEVLHMPVTLNDIQRRYDRLKTVFKVSAKDDNVAGLLIEIYHLTKEYLSDKTRLPLNSRVPGKDYFAFTVGEKRSRAVNPALFDLATTANPITGFTTVDEFWANVMSNTVTNLTAHEITCAVYAVAISFCSSIDLLKTADQKTPGTYFEFLIGHLMARQFDINPRNQMDVLNLGLRTTLPTDFIFDLGTEEPKFHVPVKTSTRERVVQVWSHQRVLDGVYGTGRFLGLLSCLAETKVDSRSLEVTEICLPDQWRLYQMFMEWASSI